MSNYIKNALTNFKNLEQKVIEKYLEKDELNQQVADIDLKYKVLYEWPVNRSFNYDSLTSFSPNPNDIRINIKRQLNIIKSEVNKCLDTDGKKTQVQSVKYGLFKNAPEEIKYLEKNTDYDKAINEYSKKINALKVDYNTKAKEYIKHGGDFSGGAIMLATFLFMIPIIMLGVYIGIQEFNPSPLMPLIALSILMLAIYYTAEIVKKHDKKTNINNFVELSKETLKTYNELSVELYLTSLFNLIHIHIDQEKTAKLEEINKELDRINDELQEIKNEYHSKETLSNEIIELYAQIDQPEKEMFFKLGMLVESEKELIDVYTKCKDAENRRLLLEEQKRYTEAAIEQTRIQQEQKRELEKQTKILKADAEAKAEHYREMERQAYNSQKAMENFTKKQTDLEKKRLEAQKKATKAAEDIYYEVTRDNNK